MKKPIVSVKDYSLTIGDKQIVEQLDFEVFPGEVFAFLGANGSGKTSTIRSLLGIYQASSGELLVNGKRLTPETAKIVGYLPEERGLYTRAKVIDAMMYFGELKGMDRDDAREFSLKFLEEVDLADKANVKIKKLSGGQQQKVQLGVTIMNDPSILILDEPTKGFDPVNRRLLMNIIDEQKAKGATIVYITHDMSEVERLCDRLILLKDGDKAAYGTVPAVLKQFKKKSMDDVFLHVYGEDALLEGGE